MFSAVGIPVLQGGEDVKIFTISVFRRVTTSLGLTTSTLGASATVVTGARSCWKSAIRAEGMLTEW